MSKKRYLWIGLLGVVLLVVVVGLLALPRGPVWTTSSPEALAEFQAAMDASMKLYHADAQRHFERALELDPSFVAAKVMLANQIRARDRKRSDALYDEVARADVQALRPRERFLVEYRLAQRERQSKKAETLLDDYLAANPDDPFVLNLKAGRLFGRGDLEDAAKLYRHLIEVDPNQVTAYNQLGYITMIGGRFSEAEEYFTSYRFIAPDQANPHDSLGELYIIQGRYDEAETSLERALEIKPDFWDSYGHLLLAKALKGDFAGAAGVADRMAAQDDAPEDAVHGLRCAAESWRLANDRRWADVLAMVDASNCLRYENGVRLAAILAHRAACKLGEWKRAEEIEAQVATAYATLKKTAQANVALDTLQGARALLQGTRLAIAGQLEQAAEKFRSAEDSFSYQESPQGIMKLKTRLMLVETLRAEGKDEEAAKVLEEVRAVNPKLVADFKKAGSTILGL